MVVAIDGPAGVGKSTLSKHIATRLGFFYLNTGSFYRSVTWLGLSRHLAPSQATAWVGLLDELTFTLVDNHLLTNGEDWSRQIYSPQVDQQVSAISAIVPLRHKMNSLFQAFAKEKDIVVEGRDMTSVVFPRAEVKLFLDASPLVRAERRFKERPDGLSFAEILAQIQSRDENDRNKGFGGLKLEPGVEYLDTSDLTIHQVCEKVEKIIQAHHLSGSNS